MFATSVARQVALIEAGKQEKLLHLLDYDQDYYPDNIGSQEKVSIQGLAEMMSEMVGFQGDIVFDTSKPDGMHLKNECD